MTLLSVAYLDPTTQRGALLRDPRTQAVATFDADLAKALASYLTLNGTEPVGLLPPPLRVRTHPILTATEARPLGDGLLAALAAFAVISA